MNKAYHTNKAYHMNKRDQQLLDKLGIIVDKVRYEQAPVNVNMFNGEMLDDNISMTLHGQFTLDEERFRPMCRLIELTDMICESKNPAITEMFNHLVTMLELTKNNTRG